MKLGHASHDEQLAAVRVVHRDIAALIEKFMSSGMAAMFKGQAQQKLESPEGKQMTLAIVDHALDAAEAVRNAAAAQVQQQPPTPAGSGPAA